MQLHRLVLQRIEPAAVFGQPGAIEMVLQVILEEFQLAVAAEHLGAHTPGVDGRRHLEQRDEQGDDGQQQHDQAIDQHGQPEGQVALQEGGPPT